MKRTFKRKTVNQHKYNILALPNTNFFKLEIVNMLGSNVEREYLETTGKNVYGISHLIEHLSFRNSQDYGSTELLKLLKNEGSYNASTDYSRINYWFSTTMDRTYLGIKLALNIAMNDLRKISQEEFDIEKKVVYNEAKRYADSDQDMFQFQVRPTICGLDAEDNVISTPEIIDILTLEDSIAIKKIFLENSDVYYNITYDPLILTENEIINQIEYEIKRLTKYNFKDVLYNIKEPESGNFKMDNPSEQYLTFINFDTEFDEIVADAGNEYLLEYAEETSLNDIIREKYGLTYGISFYAYQEMVKNREIENYTAFSCDVSAGSEELLLKLFQESIEESVKNWNSNTHKKLIQTRILKRAIRLLDQKNYNYWHHLAVWSPNTIHVLEEIAREDLDLAYSKLDEIYCSEVRIKNYIQSIFEKFNTKDYAIVTNY